ncbi:hypothetical protein PRZ48_006684 [Zasmidium cellare]|uniref:Uncharacterized protein n=1 Tax=Zasmidium cellare TaxID=395010 RepID=A0ABR0EQ47_ZASCE|nr:hypothetical protein PRZ48_006684 [Zasmidium cellare]
MATQQFLFLECEGSSGHSGRSSKQLKNRHAQLANQSKGSKGVNQAGPLSAPLPIQIKFRASEQVNEPETYFGRCARCRKRRKCEDGSARLMAQETTALNDSGNRSLSAWAYQTPSPVPCVSYDISCGMQDGPAERKAMHYFVNFASLDLSGYLPGRFWDGFVLQGSQSEPMVRQAVLAVSSAHLDHCHEGAMSATTLASYQTSVNKLRVYMSRTPHPSPELVLICCILLFTFDRLRGDHAAAAVHLQSAMAILSNAATKRRASQGRATEIHQDRINDLTNILLQMDIEDTMPALDRGPLLDIGIDAPTFFAQDPPPMKFFTPHDFMNSWMRICHAVWAFIGKNASYRHAEQIPTSVWNQRSNLQRWVKAWRVAHKEYMHFVGTPNVAELPTTPPAPALDRYIIDSINALIIESHYFVIKSVLAESLPDPSSLRPWDVIAEKMLQCGEKALALRQAYRNMHSLPTRKTFSTHVGIAESLLCLSHRTTSPDVRSRAQMLIRGFRDISGDLTGVTAFFAGYGAPPSDLVLIYEKPGH